MTKLVMCPAVFHEFITIEREKFYVSEKWMNLDLPSFFLIC